MAGQDGALPGKWLAGILATVLSAVLIWSLTHPGGLLNPEEPTPPQVPVLRIVDVQVSPASVGGVAVATVYNEGQVTGEACHLWWYSGDTVARQLEEGMEPSEASQSADFGLTPGQTRTVGVTSRPYSSVGRQGSYLQAFCSGDNVTSIRYFQDVQVTG